MHAFECMYACVELKLPVCVCVCAVRACVRACPCVGGCVVVVLGTGLLVWTEADSLPRQSHRVCPYWSLIRVPYSQTHTHICRTSHICCSGNLLAVGVKTHVSVCARAVCVCVRLCVCVVYRWGMEAPCTRRAVIKSSQVKASSGASCY